LTSADD